MLIGDADAERVAVVMWVSDLTQPKFLQKINPKKTLEKRPADLSGRVPRTFEIFYLLLYFSGT